MIRYGVIPASRGGKLKTVLQTAAIFLFLLPLIPACRGWGRGLLGHVAALAVTVVTGIDYIVKAVRLRAAAKAGHP